jgi:uncharacterized protein (TIGR00251 family)
VSGFVREESGDTLVDILVQPRASRARVGPVHGDRVKVAVTAPPVDGAANAAVVKLFAGALKLPKSAVEVTSGHSSRRKTVRLRGVARGTVEALWA